MKLQPKGEKSCLEIMRLFEEVYVVMRWFLWPLTCKMRLERESGRRELKQPFESDIS